jgi:hypothetical protein
MTSQAPPASRHATGNVSSPVLNYARPRRFARLRRWLGLGSPLSFVLILALAAGGTWGAWKWRLRADERAFKECASFGAGDFLILKPGAGWITFSKPPNAASLRHLNRLSGKWELYFDWQGPEDPAAPLILRGSRCNGVTVLWLGKGVEADVWLKELARPDTGLKALTTLGLWSTQVTDAGLKELARPDCGLKALTSLVVYHSRVTDAGIAELKKARPRQSIE